MNPANPEPRDGDGAPHSAEWWLALRRVVARVLDAAEVAARGDVQFRNDLARVFDLWPGGASEAESGLRDESGDARLPRPAPESLPPVLPAGTTAAPPAAVAGPVPSPTAEAPAAPPSTPAPPLPPLTGPREVSVIVGATAADVGRAPAWADGTSYDPAVVAARCRMKADACRWQSERRRRLDEGADVYEEDRALTGRARDAGVWLWMVSPNKWRDKSDEAFLTVAACYDALADAAEATDLAERHRHEQPLAMRLLGEAQSALRASVEDYASTKRDEDQEATFAWLRRETDARGVYVQHLQLDHPASPDNHADLRRRIGELRRALDAWSGRLRGVEQGIRKVAYHAQKIARAIADGERLDTGHAEVRGVAAAVEALLGGGLPPSDRRLRDALLDVSARMPDDVPEPLARVLNAIDAYLDRFNGADDSDADDDVPGAVSNEPTVPDAADGLVPDARRRVGGRRAVLIGGEPNESARLKLRSGLALEELEWLRVEHHEPFDRAAVAIRRPGVALVMILTRWRSHRDGPAARALCKELNIPLVELPAGYNLRQVAHQLCRQLPRSSTVPGPSTR
jgi:hypothetical protein